jgi:adenine-specific DNA-methyltransferase
MAKKPNKKTIETLTHEEASRKNIPTAEYQSVMQKDEQSPIRVAYERRNRDLDPQLVWRGKDEQDGSDLVVHAPPLYIQEKVHPKVLIDDLLRRTGMDEAVGNPEQIDLFSDFNGIPDESARTEFYQHDANWTNRMILGDSLQVMASLAEREGLRGKVQCIYLDPPYGIKFNSNFQWSTTSRDVKDGKVDHITREPEQVKAFRDTWRDGIHSYLTYLRDRLTVARDLLTDSGSIFVQIGDENVHRVRVLMDEVFGEENFVSQITFVKSSGTSSPSAGTDVLSSVSDFIIWYAKDAKAIKYRQPYYMKEDTKSFDSTYKHGESSNPYRLSDATAQKPTTVYDFVLNGRTFNPLPRGWRVPREGMIRAAKAERFQIGGKSISFRQYLNDHPVATLHNTWTDTGTGSGLNKVYVVQTTEKVIQRCIIIATDPGDLVLDPTCGSGTTAYVAEQWGRRWITIDTSRVALALARARIMGARYPYYLLADSREGQQKEAEITRSAPSQSPTQGNIRQGFVYQRVPHITLKSIANNAEIDVIWEQYQQKLEPLREQLNQALGKTWQEWQIPRELPENISVHSCPLVVQKEQTTNEHELTRIKELVVKLHQQWWELRVARQKEIDASIAAKADYEYLYDKPYEDRKKVRVAGPFTVESLSPHRVLGVDENDELIDDIAESQQGYGEEQDFVQMILENLKTAGVQQAHKEDKLVFTAIAPWPGELICAEGRYYESGEPDSDSSGTEKRAAIFVGPEFGTVSRPDLVAAAREAGDADFDVLISCAFNYDAHSSEFDKLGRIPVLKARMNADLHMADDLKNTGKGNLFVIFGEPDIDIIDTENEMIQVKVNGVDVFHPNTGEVRSDGAEGIACWFIDTDYNEESFFVRHAYFLGANDPYKSLKTTLKAEINEDAWSTLNSDTSRPFKKPESGRIAVKVINHLGDEVMKVFKIC